jgi:hypothetical protein
MSTGAQTEHDRRRSTLQEATTLLSGTAKWLIAALGAIGAALIAGSQLSSIGSLPVGPRFLAAVVGLCIGLGGVLWAIWKVLDLIAPDRYTISELSSEWEKAAAVKERGAANWRLRRKYPVADWFARNPEHLANHESPTQLFDHWKDRTAADRDRTLEAINDMILLANFRRSRAMFDRSKVPLAASMLLAAAGICAFAWAANPGDHGLPTLRNADLSGADLRGASLRNVDLTGADLSRANLRGANLEGATIDDVVWDDTMCPDGSNSDDNAGGDDSGSCIGHLTP